MRGAARRIALLLLLPMQSFAAAPDTALPRLSGVVVGPGGASAIFSDDDAGRLVVLAPGDAIGGYAIRAITPGEVVLEGPKGRLVLMPVERAGPRAESPPPPPSAAEQGAVATGATVGGLAVRYDGCVQRGLLPDSGAAGGTQLAAMLDAMARVPPRQGPRGGAAQLPAQLAAWMRQGWQAAAREAESHPDDAASCAALAADWRRVALTYGFQ